MSRHGASMAVTLTAPRIKMGPYFSPGRYFCAGAEVGERASDSEESSNVISCFMVTVSFDYIDFFVKG